MQSKRNIELVQELFRTLTYLIFRTVHVTHFSPAKHKFLHPRCNELLLSMDTSKAVPKIIWKELNLAKKIGSGTFCEVYEGTWKGTTVAIKRLFLNALPDHLMKDFEEECTLLHNCRFEHIAQLYGVCVEEGHCAMIMELYSKSLYDVLP
jgi:serine/threonine protein kinase